MWSIVTVVVTILFSVIGTALASDTPSPLVCLSADDAVALVQTACQLDDACRFYFKGGVPRTLLEQRLHIVQPAISASLPAAVDLRTFYQPPAWWESAPLVAYNASAESDTPGYATNCSALASALNGTQPPPEVRDALYALLVYQTLLADDRVCTDVNEIPVWDDVSGVFRCACAAGHVCASSTATSGSLLNTTVILFGVVIGLAALGVIVASVYTTYTVLKKRHRVAERKTSSLRLVTSRFIAV